MTGREVKDFLVENNLLVIGQNGDFILSDSSLIQTIQGVQTIFNQCDEAFVQRRIFAGKGNFRSMPTVGAEVRNYLNAPMTSFTLDRVRKDIQKAVETNSSFRYDKAEISGELGNYKVRVHYQRIK